MKKLFIILLSFHSFQILGQDFKCESAIPPVDQPGFYKVLISPDISACASQSFSDLRIFNQTSKEVPYIIQTDQLIQYTKLFREYELIEKRNVKNYGTTLILKNPDQGKINNISLKIKNADVTKRATLRGSDDQKEWFALKEEFYLYNINNQSETSEIKILDFPLSNYVYYRLDIEDSTSAPLNILSAGYYDTFAESGKYIQLTKPSIRSIDSAELKQTFIYIEFDKEYIIDKFQFDIAGAPFYFRNSMLYQTVYAKNKKGELQPYDQLVASLSLNSNSENTIGLSGMKGNKFLLVVNNDDNPSLDIKVNAYQLNRYIVAWLEPGNSYTIKFGNKELTTPVYDLEFFKDKVPGAASILTAGPVNQQQEISTPTKDEIFTTKRIIWIAIILVIILLGVMSLRMIRNVDPK